MMLAVATALPLYAQETAPVQAQEPELVVPSGTILPTVLNTYLNTKNTQVGDIFYADTTYPIWIQQRLVIPRGSIIKGTVTAVVRPGKVSGKGKMAIRFDSILLPNGVQRSLIANFHGIHGPGAEKIDRQTETVEQGSTSNKGNDARTVVGTAGTGAWIGGVVDRSASGALIGAGAGAGAGLAIALLSRDRDLILEPGIQLDMELSQPLRFAYGEVMFTQTELDSAGRTPGVRANRGPVKKQTGFPGTRLPRFWR
jgi:type IV secretion system protein VirB10